MVTDAVGSGVWCARVEPLGSGIILHLANGLVDQVHVQMNGFEAGALYGQMNALFDGDDAEVERRELEAEVCVLEEEITELKEEIGDLKAEVARLKGTA